VIDQLVNHIRISYLVNRISYFALADSVWHFNKIVVSEELAYSG